MKPAPVESLVNSFEFEQAAKDKLPSAIFKGIAGSDRRPFDRITLRPRMMIDTRKLDLSVNLFGTPLITPIIAQSLDTWAVPLAAGDEAAAARGASEARTALIAGNEAALRAMKEAPAIYRVPGQATAATAAPQIARAAGAGAKAAVVNLAALPKKADLPLIAAGIRSAADAQRAINSGASAVFLNKATTGPHPMSLLLAVTSQVSGKVPILIGGDFRRGTDILMALALGASAVVITRPTAWALAGYGAEGVEALYLLLATELARNMAMCGKVSLAALGPDAVKIHAA